MAKKPGYAGSGPGYKPPRTLYKLRFADGAHEGLVVVARGSSFKGLMDIMGIGVQLDGLDVGDRDDFTLAEVAELRNKLAGLFDPFAKVLHDWNVVDDDGTPVPATLDGLLDQEVPFVMEVIEAYLQAVSQAPPPLPSSSSSGGTSPDAPPDLASASRSPGSSPGPS